MSETSFGSLAYIIYYYAVDITPTNIQKPNYPCTSTTNHFKSYPQTIPTSTTTDSHLVTPHFFATFIVPIHVVGGVIIRGVTRLTTYPLHQTLADGLTPPDLELTQVGLIAS